ncbi:hypothetical protein ACPV52_20835, partial [Vibrio astriarenae]
VNEPGDTTTCALARAGLRRRPTLARTPHLANAGVRGQTAYRSQDEAAAGYRPTLVHLPAASSLAKPHTVQSRTLAQT